MKRLRKAAKKETQQLESRCPTTISLLRVLLVAAATAVIVLDLSSNLTNASSISCSETWTTPSLSATATSSTSENMAPLSPLKNPNQGNCPSPSFVNQGAVFVFFHLAKAGGTTIRFLFKDPPISAEILMRTNLDWADTSIRKWLADSTETRNLFVEIHHVSNPSVEKMVGYLQDWRKMADLHNKPLFVFTVVREPLSYALSYFSYQNFMMPQTQKMPRYHHWDGTGRRADLTNHDLLDFTLPSPQCLFYSRGELATTVEFPIYGSKWNAAKECPEVYQSMTKYMDWIGTVETMQDQMLPLLTFLSNNDPEIGRGYHRKNPGRPIMKQFAKAAMANKTVMAALEGKLDGDRWMHNQVQQDYKWESYWGNCNFELL